MSEQRLQKILARAGVASRRGAEELIVAGRVTVNGKVAEIGVRVDAEKDSIKVDGKRIAAPTPDRYLVLNKPRAVMSTVADPEGRPTVMELVPRDLRKALVPVGRLDFLTEGLLLLTDDGDFAQRVAHPRYGCTKTYEVKVKGFPEESAVDRLREGIVLDGKRTSPARIERRRTQRRPGEKAPTNSWWTVEIGEGRTRQIREMFQRIGHPVGKLRRVAIGTLRDDTLAPGELRPLTEREVAALLKPTPKKSSPTKKGAAARKGPAGKGSARSGPARKGPARSGPGRQGPARKGSAGSGPARKGPAKTGPGPKPGGGAKAGFRPSSKGAPKGPRGGPAGGRSGAGRPTRGGGQGGGGRPGRPAGRRGGGPAGSKPRGGATKKR
ncbi:MAG: pseudouridine synthase [Acidobacteriota bacterium]